MDLNQKSDETSTVLPIGTSLKSALRRARLEESERSEVFAELRSTEIARLEMLAEELGPVYAQLPDDIDIFDAGVVPGEHSRLYIDMIGFVEMADDKRTYRFIQDTRHGRITIRETDHAGTMVAEITDYIARRMLERERAMASDQTIETAAERLLLGHSSDKTAGADADTTANATPRADLKKAGATAEETNSSPRSKFAWAWEAIEFLALFIGFIMLLIAVAGGLYFAWQMFDLGILSGLFGSAS